MALTLDWIARALGRGRPDAPEPEGRTTAVCVATSRVSACPRTCLQTSRTMGRSLRVAKGEGTSETKVSEKERRFLAPAGEAASSSPLPGVHSGWPGNVDGRQADRISRPRSPEPACQPNYGSGTRTHSSSHGLPSPSARRARCQGDSPASALRGAAYSADDWPLRLAFLPPLPTSL